MVDVGKTNSKIPERSYHKRGENEEMSKQEFAHRLSVFFKKGHSINLQYDVNGSNPNSSSLFEKDIEQYVMGNIDLFFDLFDENKSEGISFEELRKMLSGGDVALADLAKGLTQYISWNNVPDNPENVLENQSISKEEFSKRIDDLRAKNSEMLYKPKPSIGVSKFANEEAKLAEDEDKFWHKPTENTYVMFNGHKILYKDGYYSTPERNDIKPNRNIYGITMVIIAEKKEKTASNFKTQMANAKTNEEKRAAIDTLLEDLSSWYSPFQPGFLKDNYGPGEKPEVEHFAGLRISFTVSEDYRPIFNKAALYRQANCAED